MPALLRVTRLSQHLIASTMSPAPVAGPTASVEAVPAMPLAWATMRGTSQPALDAIAHSTEIDEVRTLMDKLTNATWRADAAVLRGMFAENAIMCGYTQGHKKGIGMLDVPETWIKELEEAASKGQSKHAKGLPHTAQVLSIKVFGGVATALIRAHVPHLIDEFQLVKFEGQWKIVSKLYKGEAAPSVSLVSEPTVNTSPATSGAVAHPNEFDEVRALMDRFTDATWRADAAALRSMFAENAVMNGYIQGDKKGFGMLGVPETWIKQLEEAASKGQSKQAQGVPHAAQVLSITVYGGAATALVRAHVPHLIDEFQLVRLDEKWKIVSKMYKSEGAP